MLTQCLGHCCFVKHDDSKFYDFAIVAEEQGEEMPSCKLHSLICILEPIYEYIISLTCMKRLTD